MSDDYGTCVVLTVGAHNNEVEDLPSATVEGGPHITLVYFGDTSLPPEMIEELKALCEETSALFPLEFLETGYIQTFNDDAVVLGVDDTENSIATRVRSYILARISDELYMKFKEAETYPDYIPHLTLGYISKGFSPDEIGSLPDELVINGLSIWDRGEQHNYAFDNPYERDETGAYIRHIGVERRSGRYPWGSGDSPYQRHASFIGAVDELKRQGFTEAQVASSLGMTSRELRARKSIAKNEMKKADVAQIIQLKERNYSNVAIAEKLGISEGQVRRLLDPVIQAKTDKLTQTKENLASRISEDRYLDFGEGTENFLGVSKEHLETAVKALQEEGYTVHHIKVQQLGTGEMTTMRVLAPPDVTTSEVYSDISKIQPAMSYTDAAGVNHLGLKPIESIDSSRLEINYTETGGHLKDGVIELRRGVADIDLGEAAYAQVRIGVDGTHYLKGMAVYSDDLPKGVDVRFNTNKSKDAGLHDTLKPMKDDPDNPFGSSVHQKEYISADGKTKTSALNIVNQEGDWDKWSKTLSSQFLSKQPESLVKSQLGQALDIKKAEFDEIMSLTNPVVKKDLLISFADDCDASAVHLKAHALPRQRNQVILPITSMKEGEVYAPNFKNGERVVLVRHPHGGIFEIPELVVNNKNPAAKKTLGTNPIDAIGIHPKVAERLSGADFDGDTVLVIPNNKGLVKTAPALSQLKDFDPKALYGPKVYPNAQKIKDTQGEMGKISNLITDMTIKGAKDHEIARAVKHSMVVIDADKHGLNYKQSYKDNRIDELKTTYQGGPQKGASTLISLAKSKAHIPEIALRKASQGGAIDPTTGAKVYVETGRTYTKRDKAGNIVTLPSGSTVAKMELTTNAHTLSSGTRVENVYASHANALKGMGNRARLESLSIKAPSRNPSAAKTYAPEVSSLTAKYNTALKNKPLERKAQIVGNLVVREKRKATPNMEKDELKKLKAQALRSARQRTGASKSLIEFSDKEWAAVQAGALSPTLLGKILKNANKDQVKQLSMPRTQAGLSPAHLARAKAMANNGYSQSDIASALGVSTTTINTALKV